MELKDLSDFRLGDRCTPLAPASYKKGVSVGLRRFAEYSFHCLITSLVTAKPPYLLAFPEALNGLREFPRGQLIVVLNGLTLTLNPSKPKFCCHFLGLLVCISCLRCTTSQLDSIGLLLQLDSLPYFQCPPMSLGIVIATCIRDLMATASDGCINNREEKRSF